MTSNDMTNKYMTLQEAYDYLRLDGVMSLKTFKYTRVTTQLIPSVSLTQGHYLFTARDLDIYIDSKRPVKFV